IPLIFIFSSTTPIGPGCDLIGEEATTFRIGDVEGNVYDLNEQIGQKQLIVLEFFNTDCPWCEVMAPQLGDLHEYYGWGETVGFVSMSSSAGDSVQSVRDFRDSYAEGTNMTYIHDSSHSLAGDYCVSATPTTVFIDDSGKIVKWSEGAKNFDQMVTIIDNLLQG
ncbi:MAG: TlpA family protein disulfide reductase, partial [Thermoplasmata archaeon]|nr:TlpA family protein disulfide reductase [Thermoplasmata archaeon]